MSAATAQSAAKARTSVSYWSVVGSQLKKNRIAMGAARTVAALVAMAVGAPLLAMNAPLVALDVTGVHIPLLTPEGMGVHAPLLDTLFNRDMYPSGVDVFFNLLLVVGVVWFVGARIPAALLRRKEVGLHAMVKPRSRLADGMALSAAGLLVVLSFLPEGSGGWPVTLLRAMAWIVLLPALPWAGPIALFFAGAWIVIAGPAFLGWLLIALAFPTVTGLVLLAYLLLGAVTGAIQGSWALLWLMLPGVVGGLLWVYAARRSDEAPGDLRRSDRLRLARWASLVLFLVAFVVLVRFPQTRPVIDWTKTLATTEARGVMPPIPYHPDNVGEQGLGPAERSRQRPSKDHVLGCDLNGRDVAARLIFGTRISLTIGLVAVSLYVTIGVILGSLAGYYGGWVDILISRAVEVMICFPVLFLLLTIVAVFDTRSIFLIMAGIGIVGWPTVARLVRGEFLRQRNLDYVTAAQAQGLPEWRVIFGHVLPNCVGPVLVSATFGIAAAILTESGLAFLGLGDTTAASWGQMLKDGRDSGLWHMIFSPGFAIFFVVTVFNLLGEGLRDALDPKLRR